MDIKHITSDSLRRLLSLTDKKEQLIKAVSEVEDQIVRTLKGAATTTVEVAEAVTPFKKAKKARKAKGSKPGGLKERILALLEEAGDEGIRVKDLAAKLASKPGNIAVWFSTTGKKLVTKVEPGRYAVKGAKKSAAKTSAAATPKKTSKPAKKKSGITPEGRAKLAANMKARWAARKAGKPAKKGFKLAKKS
jgi:hypothetical protein